VFGTLHTTGAARTVDRIVDAFPTNQQAQIRVQLASSIQAVVSQVLLPTIDGKGRVAAFEIMIMNDAIENHIRKNETFRIDSAIQTGRKFGNVLLDEMLFDLFRTQKISYQEALRSSQSPIEFAKRVQQSAGT
jgi:twitching motility protein PilT